jgi:polygalacturonase
MTNRMKLPLLILLASSAVCGMAATAAPSPRVFNARSYGAKGDGTSLDTAPIQKALAACAKAGGGTVRLPAGNYLSGPLKIKDNTTLLLEAGATLRASPDHKLFMKEPGDWLQARSGGDFIPLLSGQDLTNVTITGAGAIDGNGAVWWEEAEKARRKVSGYTLPRPNLVVLQRCRNLKVTGITLQNSPKFHLVPTECEEVLVDGITILAPAGAANTDGIDPSNCRNVTITRCTIDCGDDNVAIKSGKQPAGREFGCENITITDCTFKHGHGMSIGSETVGGVRNVLVKHCTFQDTDNGLRIKSRRGRGGRVEQVTYTDCALSNCHPAISIMCYYQNSTHDAFPREDQAQPMTPTTPAFRHITIRNVTGNATGAVGLIVGLPESPIEDITLENVSLRGKQGLILANTKGAKLNRVQLSVEEGKPVELFNAGVQGLDNGAKAEDKNN